MATAVVMPKLGNSVETSIIASWKKKKGDRVAQGDILCDIETDKATIDVESPVAGTLLEVFFNAGDEVPVMMNIAAIGEPGENVEALWPDIARRAESGAPVVAPGNGRVQSGAPALHTPPAAAPANESGKHAISPRARHLAESTELDVTSIAGSGPGGRIIERDIQSALAAMPRLTPLAKSMVESGDYVAPEKGSGPGGRVTTRDLVRAAALTPAVSEVAATPASTSDQDDILQVIPLKGTRKIIATRMLQSIQSTAQLPLNASADARALLAYRKRLKASLPALGVQDVTINDLILFVVSRALLQYPDLNAWFSGDSITQYRPVHLGFAVDTPRGLIVPVIRSAQALSLKQIALESKRLATACQEGTVKPDELNGGTFTVTNLGNLGIESFTPVINIPQVAILGVGNVNLKPVEEDGEIGFVPHLGLSLTINHQVVDGAPGARFLQALSKQLADLELVLAL